MITHVLGFPVIGKNREYKKMLEAYWNGKIDERELNHRSDQLRLYNWRAQKNAGMTYVSCGDFALYDHVLDTSMMLGAIPHRFGIWNEASEIPQYFDMARGNEKKNIPAMEMTKWFNTNYHYISR
jgi:5-methyltetrahydropteroyltriglutamate--homocysteine methyltransferase